MAARLFMCVSLAAAIGVALKASMSWFFLTHSSVLNGLISFGLGAALCNALEKPASNGCRRTLIALFVAGHLAVYLSPYVTDFYARTYAFATEKSITYEAAARSRDRFLTEKFGSAGLFGYFKQLSVQPPGPVRPVAARASLQ